MYSFTFFSYIYLLNGLIAAFMAFIMWQKRRRPGLRYLLVYQIAVIVWSLCLVFRSAAASFEVKMFWSQMSTPAITSTALFYMFFAVAFRRHEISILKRKLLLLLLIFPFLFAIAAFTNSQHHLFWPEFAISPDTGLVFYTRGPLLWAMLAFIYTVLTAGIILLFRSIFKQSRSFTPQFIMLISGSVIPIAGSVIYIFNLLPYRGLDVTLLSFSLSSVVFFWGMVYRRIFDVIPVAHTAVIESMNEGFILVNVRNCILEMNPAAYRILDLMECDITGIHISEIFPWLGGICLEKGNCSAEINYPPKTDTYFEVNKSVIFSKKKSEIGRLLIIRDISERKKTEILLQKLARTDGLTGLLNRRCFLELSEAEFVRARRFGKKLSVLMIDADDFKSVNDTYGHAAGDRVLTALSESLNETLRGIDITGRLGGEEFAVLLPEIGIADAESAARRILSSVRKKHIDTAYGRVSFTVSIGIAEMKHPDDTLDEILKYADTALYDAKACGKDCCRVYSSGMLSSQVESLFY